MCMYDNNQFKGRIEVFFNYYFLSSLWKRGDQNKYTKYI